MNRSAEQYNEPTPRYSCCVEGCPGNHPSKYGVCHRTSKTDLDGALAIIEGLKAENADLWGKCISMFSALPGELRAGDLQKVRDEYLRWRASVETESTSLRAWVQKVADARPSCQGCCFSEEAAELLNPSAAFSSSEKTSWCNCPDVCQVCGGRARACAILGHRADSDRHVKWHECPQVPRSPALDPYTPRKRQDVHPTAFEEINPPLWTESPESCRHTKVAYGLESDSHYCTQCGKSIDFRGNPVPNTRTEP